MSRVLVRKAVIDDSGTVAGLYSAYCGFYRSDVTPEAAGKFVRERLEREEAVVFIAETRADTHSHPTVAVGFTLLYPKFSSTRLQRDWILNDLFVAPEHRREGAAQALLQAAVAFVKDSGSRVVALKTQVENSPARSLYERAGWRLDEKFVTYVFDVEQHTEGNNA